MPLTFADVKKVGLKLPDVEVGTTWGTPALKVRGKMFACIASHSSAEKGTLVVRMSFDARDALVADDPGTYYLKPHYVGHPCVLARLSALRSGALPDLLHAGWQFATGPKGPDYVLQRKRRSSPAARRRWDPLASLAEPARSTRRPRRRPGAPRRRRT